MISQFRCPQRGHKSLKDLCFSFSLSLSELALETVKGSLSTRQWHSSRFECRLYDPLMLGEIGGNDRADGARDITNPIMNSLSFGLDTLFLFISRYLSLVCMHFIFITVAHVKAERGSMNISWICCFVSCIKLMHWYSDVCFRGQRVAHSGGRSFGVFVIWHDLVPL